MVALADEHLEVLQNEAPELMRLMVRMVGALAILRLRPCPQLHTVCAQMVLVYTFLRTEKAQHDLASRAHYRPLAEYQVQRLHDALLELDPFLENDLVPDH
jgi:hypothetical protein